MTKKLLHFYYHEVSCIFEGLSSGFRATASVWGSVACFCLACLLSSVPGFAGSAASGRHWQWSLRVSGPPTAPLLQQSRGGLWTSHTDGIKAVHRTAGGAAERRRSPHCVHRTRHQTLCRRMNEQILFVDSSRANKDAHVWACTHKGGLAARAFALTGIFSFCRLLTRTQRRFLQVTKEEGSTASLRWLIWQVLFGSPGAGRRKKQDPGSCLMLSDISK